MTDATVHVEQRAAFPGAPDTVWKRLGNFDDISWMPGVDRVRHLTPGRVREVFLQGADQSVTEALVAETDRTQTFRFTDPGPLPVADYVAQLKVARRGEISVVTWSADFNPRAATAEAAAAQMLSWYKVCLENAGGQLMSAGQ